MSKNAESATPTVSFATDKELARWLRDQAAQTGLSLGQVARFHLDRARGESAETALIRQLSIGGFGDIRKRIAVALARIRPLIADAMAVALSAPEESVADEIDQVFTGHVEESDPRRGFPVHPVHNDGLPSAKPKGRRGRRGKRGGA